MLIRSALKEDALPISELVNALVYHYLSKNVRELPDWLLSSLKNSAFEDRLSSEEFITFILESKGEIIGYIALKKPNHLYHLFVNESYQGRGIAKKLWIHLLENCEEKTISVNSSMNAVEVYKRFGFIETDIKQEKEGIWFLPMEFHSNFKDPCV